MPGFENNLWLPPQEGVEDQFDGTSTIEHDPGLLAIPVAGPPGTPPEIARVHAGITRRVVRFSGMKTGARPDAIHPQPPDNNQVLVGAGVTVVFPQLVASGKTHTWSLGGTYTYVLLDPPEIGADDLPAGKKPFDTTSSANTSYPASKFRTDLMG